MGVKMRPFSKMGVVRLRWGSGCFCRCDGGAGGRAYFGFPGFSRGKVAHQSKRFRIPDAARKKSDATYPTMNREEGGIDLKHVGIVREIIAAEVDVGVFPAVSTPQAQRMIVSRMPIKSPLLVGPAGEESQGEKAHEVRRRRSHKDRIRYRG